MSTITPYRSGQQPGRDDFPHLLRAEWTKFRTVRGWVIAMVATALLTGLATVTLAGALNGGTHPSANPGPAIGPGGEAVTDDFYSVHRLLDGNGSITARVTSLADGPMGVASSWFPQGKAPWAKAGIIIKASTKAGSAYAAVMATLSHGVRMQYNYTHDTAGLAGPVSAAAPRWLRLTRSGDTITGYDSVDATHWQEIGTASLAGLPRTAQAGLFVASPPYIQAYQQFASNSVATVDTRATAAFDHVSLQGAWPGGWRGGRIGSTAGIVSHCVAVRHQIPGHFIARCSPGGGPQAGSFTEAGGRFTLAGSGDIAPYVPEVDPLGTVFKGSLMGLIAVIALGALFITAEYRRGMIRTTFAASPRRGRVLAAKAIVIGSVTFVAGLAGAAVALPITEHKLHSLGWASSIFPIWSLTSGHGLQMVVGTAGLLAVAAILALAAGAVLRRSAGAIAAVIVLLIFPLILGTVLPQGDADWLLRLTPAAAFGLQQGIPQYPQVATGCEPYNGCYPLAPWTGFAVLCVWAAIALGIAVYLLRRRDA